MCKKLIFLISFVLVLSLANVASASTPDDLVLWAEYNFDAPDPNADTSGNDFHIFELETGASTGVVEGYEGTCYHGDLGDYNAVDDAYENLPCAHAPGEAWPSLPGTDDTGNFTIEMMIRFDELWAIAWDPIIGEYRDKYGHTEADGWEWFSQSPLNYGSWYFQFEYGEYDEFSVFWLGDNCWYEASDGGDWWGYVSTVQYEKDTWYHWVSSFDNEHKVMRHWIDGELMAEDSDHAADDFLNTGTGDDIFIGRFGWPDGPHRGRIDGLRFYKGYTTTSFEPGYPARPNPRATGPEPGDGADGVARPVTLTWKPGNWVQDVNGHDVYFGTSFADVNDANKSDTTGIYRGPNDVYSYLPDPCDANIVRYAYDVCDSLDLGKQYFWRIDEVNEAYVPTGPLDPCIPPDYRWKSSIWSFTAEGKALNPVPPDEAEDVSLYIILRWTPGVDAATHDVYFGTTFDAVNDANTLTPVIYRDTCDVDANFYDPPEELLLGKTYYWRIDEANDVNVKGNVWSFSTGYWDLIEDFESYTSSGKLDDVWKDCTTKYYGGGGPDNYNAASVVLVYEPAPYHSPIQSMKYVYEWPLAQAPKYCVVWREYESPGVDWTEKGLVSLVLWFYGDANDGEADPCFADGMSVTLEDDDGDRWTIEYDGDAGDLIAKEWMMWGLSFKDFKDGNNVDAEKITQMEIRIIGGSYGQIYFDDVRLYAPVCFEGYAPDITGDCVWNEEDLDVLLGGWLEVDQDYYIYPQEPCDANLILKYTFDPCAAYDDLGNPWDSSGHGYHGVAINDVNVHDGMLTLENEIIFATPWEPWSRPNDQNGVLIGGGFNDNLPFNDSYTIMFKFRSNALDYIFMTCIPTDPCNTDSFDHGITWRINLNGYGFEGEWGVSADHSWIEEPGLFAEVADGEWHRAVFTYDANTGYHGVYVDGSDVEAFPAWESSISFDNNLDHEPLSEYATQIGSSTLHTFFPWEEDGCSSMTGDMDEVRIYDYCATLEQATYLSTGSLDPVHKQIPVDEDINLYKEGFPNDVINFKDYAVLADKWLEAQLFGE